MLLLATLATPMHAQPEQTPQPPLAPEVETKLSEFLKKARETKRAQWERETKSHVERIVQVTGLDAERAKSLDAPAQAAIASSLEEWAEKFGRSWRQWAQRTDEVRLEVLVQSLTQMATGAQVDWFGGYKIPIEQPQWAAALRSTLSAEQAAAWEKSERQRRADVEKELGGPFLATIERRKTQVRASCEKKAAAIADALKLPPERVREFTALADSIASASAEQWRERARRLLLSMGAAQRTATLKRGAIAMYADQSETKNLEADWEAGVARLLSVEETARLRETQSGNRERRIAALAQIVVEEFDTLVAFTAAQRQRIEPIAVRLVRANPDLLPDAEREYFQIAVQSLLSLGHSVKSAELEPILDATQRARWAEASANRSATARTIRLVLPQKSAPAATQPAEPEELEGAISDHFHEQAAAERKRLLAAHLLKAEDAARVAQLGGDAVARLRTAARGSAEEELAVWKANTEQTVRGQLRDVTLEGLKQRLAAMGRFGMMRRTSATGELGGLWEATVKSELTPEQRAAWQKELDAREAYRDRAIAAFILAEFDRRAALSAAQSDKLRPRIAETVRQYAPDIASMFSYPGGHTWYLSSHSMFLPIAAVPEAELKALLTKEQWERWTGGQEFGHFTNYWENIQRNHGNRVRGKTE